MQCQTAFCYPITRRREAEAVRRFCGTACYFQSMREGGRPFLRKPANVTCERCGQPFHDKPSKLANGRRFCSNACRGAWQSDLPVDQWPAKLSANLANRARGRKNGMFGKSPPHPKPRLYRSLDGRVIKMRSGWETTVASYFDLVGIRWEYEPQRFDLGSVTYKPDFYLPDEGCFWEVKGWFHARAKRRAMLFRHMHPELPLVVLEKTGYYMLRDALRAAQRQRAQ